MKEKEVAAETQEDFAALTVTFKFGGGFDAPWLVARAGDAEALEETLLIVKEHNLGKIVSDLAKTFHGVYLEGDEKPAKTSRRSSRDGEEDEDEEETPTRRGRSTQSSSRGGSRGSSRNRDEEPEYHPEGVECTKRGCNEVLIYKSGISKAGNKYALWTCPNGRSKGDGHSSEFVN